MGFWVFMLAMDLLVPLTMICFGRRFAKNAPKKINMAFGYRTTMSMKNQSTWVFAHRYIGKLWSVWGWILSLAAVLVMLAVVGKEIVT